MLQLDTLVAVVYELQSTISNALWGCAAEGAGARNDVPSITSR